MEFLYESVRLILEHFQIFEEEITSAPKCWWMGTLEICLKFGRGFLALKRQSLEVVLFHLYWNKLSTFHRQPSCINGQKEEPYIMKPRYKKNQSGKNVSYNEGRLYIGILCTVTHGAKNSLFVIPGVRWIGRVKRYKGGAKNSLLRTCCISREYAISEYCTTYFTK